MTLMTLTPQSQATAPLKQVGNGWRMKSNSPLVFRRKIGGVPRRGEVVNLMRNAECEVQSAECFFVGTRRAVSY